jgi:hypothetical protein
VTPEERVRIAKHALSGQHLTGWWAEDWKGARSAAVSARSCWARSGEWGETRANGVHVWFGARYEGPPPGLDERDFEKRVRPADVILTWREVHEVVERGATPERRAAYVAAHRAYAEQMTTPVPHPNRPRRPGKGWDYFTDPKNVAHWQANTDAIRRLHEASDAIIEAGCVGSASWWLDLDRLADELISLGGGASAEPESSRCPCGREFAKPFGMRVHQRKCQTSLSQS